MLSSRAADRSALMHGFGQTETGSQLIKVAVSEHDQAASSSHRLLRSSIGFVSIMGT
jgi:hypothetical protein